ncbi:MAG: 16S rRNA (cytidine(1402)-2'-O)-methyltransferase [Patescibacteria group bacterium]
MLYVVGTPIGNLKDITLRALEILKSVDLIACEDTRVTSKLLARYEISKTLISYHQYSKLQKIDLLINELKNGKNIALVSDAGTPTISDPGDVLVNEAYKNNIKVISIPGVSACISAISISGFNTNEFVFLGFLPKKKGRETMFKSLQTEKRLIIFYESPFRIKKTLNDILEKLGDKEVFVARELTKMFEEVYRGKVSEIMDKVKEKGEFVVVIKN